MNSPIPGKLISIQVGLPRRMVVPEDKRTDFNYAEWTSGIFKNGVTGKVRIRPTGIAGDGQADLDNHGGPDNVVLAYDLGHYPFWRETLGIPELGPGSFGENFTVEGFSDDSVCIGDVWRLGTGQGDGGTTMQVSQPRQPCFKLGRRIGTNEAIRLTIEKGWGGWYLRVLQEGYAEAGMSIELLQRPHPEWPVQKAVWLMYERKKHPERAGQLARLPELSTRWKRELHL